MKITKTSMSPNDRYVKVEANVGCGERDRGIYYIRNENWIKLESDPHWKNTSDLFLLQMADAAWDPITNTLIKNRFPDLDSLSIALAGE